MTRSMSGEDNISDPYTTLYLVFKVIFHFPNGKSSIWGIYRDFFLGPLKQIQDVCACAQTIVVQT